MPSPDRDGADVADDLRGRAAVGPRDQAEGRGAADAAVGRGPDGREILERREPEAGRDRHDHRVGRRRLARGRPARSAESASVRRRLVDRQAGLHLQDAEAVHRAGRRHGAVRLHLHPDEPEAGHLDPGRRAEADGSACRPSHHQQPGRRRRHGAGSGAEAHARSEPQGDRRRTGRPGAGTALRRVRRRRRPQDSRGRRHRAADALHDDRPEP